jgi:hypothetical protein
MISDKVQLIWRDRFCGHRSLGWLAIIREGQEMQHVRIFSSVTRSHDSSGTLVNEPPMVLCHSFQRFPSKIGFVSGTGASWNSGGGGNVCLARMAAALAFFAGHSSHSMYPFQPWRSSAKIFQGSSSSGSTPFNFGSSSKRSLASDLSCVLAVIV